MWRVFERLFEYLNSVPQTGLLTPANVSTFLLFVVGKTKIHGILIFKENYQKGSISWQKYSW